MSEGHFIVNSYEEALTLTSQAGDAVIQVLELFDGGAKVVVNPATWRATPTQSLEIRLTPIVLRLPLVTPVRFAWSSEATEPEDDGIYGSIVQWPATIGRPLPGGRRFCHPRLECHIANEIARKASTRGGLPEARQWLRRHSDFSVYDANQGGFAWSSWYGRLHQALWNAVWKMERSLLTAPWKYLKSTLQKAVNGLMARGKDDEDPSIPMTDDVLLLRHMFEIELGYPEPLDTRLYDAIKGQFLLYADRACSNMATGKSAVGRQVARIPPTGIESHVTGRRIPLFQLACSAMEPWCLPIRDNRENRGNWLPLRHPTPPRLTLPGIATPEVMSRCMTSVLAAAIDLIDLNLFLANALELDDELLGSRLAALGQETSGDVMLFTPDGAEALAALKEQTSRLSSEEFEEVRPDLEVLPGYQATAYNEFVEHLETGTGVFEQWVRVSYDGPREAGHDKYKLLWGGLKGAGDRIRCLYTKIGGVEHAIQLVFSERDAWKKGARVTFAGMMATAAGMSELDPTWRWDQLLDQIQARLKEQGLNEEGRFAVYAKRTVWTHNGARISAQQADDLLKLDVTPKPRSRREAVPLCDAVVGWVPVVRATETETQQTKLRSGISMSPHMRNLMGIRLPESPSLAKTAEQVAELGEFFYQYETLAPLARR